MEMYLAPLGLVLFVRLMRRCALHSADKSRPVGPDTIFLYHFISPNRARLITSISFVVEPHKVIQSFSILIFYKPQRGEIL
ncbi:hypothetical protein BH10BAC4_BH10BAC4_11450 [soil metagenome]